MEWKGDFDVGGEVYGIGGGDCGSEGEVVWGGEFEVDEGAAAGDGF